MGYDRKPGLTTQLANGGQYEDADTSSSFSYQQLTAESTSSAIQSASEAAASAAAALVSQTSAGLSATSASTSATTASAAATTAINASNSAVNAAATTAGSVTAASNAATSANTSANNASASASNALTYSNNASASASSANSAMVSAQSARDSALAVYDSFDDRYLGAKSSDPSVDNDGNPLITGALYFNTTSNLMKVYSGSTWVVTYATVTDVNLATQVTGTLGINNGGTGQTTANTAFNALAPSQTGNSGKYLSTDGSTTAWTNISSGSMSLVSTVTASGASTIDMPGIFTSTYDQYLIFAEGLNMTNSTTVYLYFYINGSLYFDTGNYGTQLQYCAGGWGTLFATSSQNQGYLISPSYGIHAPLSQSLTLSVVQPLNTSIYKSVSVSGTWSNSSNGTAYPLIGAIGAGTTNNLTGLKISPAAGTITGVVRVYGLKNS